MTLGNVVVTGGSGFIGTHLVTRLLTQAKSITVVDLAENSNGNVSHLSIDIRDYESLTRNTPSQVDTIFHLAARTSVLESIKDPQGVFETNIIGTQNILEMARLKGASKVLLASTNAVVGDFQGPKITENSPLHPLTPYGSTKAAGEMLASAYSGSFGISAVPLRLTNVYGTGMQKKDSIVPRLMRTALGISNFSIYGDGEQFRDYVNVTDVARAFVHLAQVDHIGPVIIGTGESISVNTLVQFTSEIVGFPIPCATEPAKAGEMRGVRVDNSLAKKLGVSFNVDFKTGISQVWEEFSSISRS